MKLVVGLGNPGEKFASTRHNIGYMVVERLSHELGNVPASWKEESDHKALTCHVGEVILVKQLTFMNTAGIAVKHLVDYYKILPGDVWVIHDDIDLPLGKLRIRMGGASAGHHGVDSIISNLKTDKFVRFRLGVGRGKESSGMEMDKHLDKRSVISFVLSRFRSGEAGPLKHLVKNCTAAVKIALLDGLDKAMNRFN